ncbi:MAG TPA: serine hydrolase domain-containing protein [Bryobacteraceae bacterium]|nr:serine hydrolase domain-containing protein [Bryobacteraceae bacterium]
MLRKLPVFLLFAALAAGAPPDARKAGMDPQHLARIPERMRAFVDQNTIAGAVTLVARHGAIAELDAVGWQDIEAKKPMRTDTIFQIMSMTKPVTAAAIMMLAEEGRLGLLDPVERHLPEFHGQWLIEKQEGSERRVLKRPERPIIIRDLLTHTSGMRSDPPEGADRLLSRFDLTLAQAVTIYSQQPLEFEPGTRWMYSNTGIATLGRIIEVASGKPYEQFLSERIFKPLGMTDSFFFPPGEKIGRIAMLYDLQDGKLKRAGAGALGGDPALYRKGAKYPCPECGLYSTANDLAAFYQMMLNGGTYNGQRLLSRAGVEVMTALHTGDLPAGHSPGMGYGLAWAVVRQPLGAASFRSIGAYGHGGAFGTEGWVDPKRDMVEILLIQRSEGGSDAERNALWNVAASAIVE